MFISTLVKIVNPPPPPQEKKKQTKKKAQVYCPRPTKGGKEELIKRYGPTKGGKEELIKRYETFSGLTLDEPYHRFDSNDSETLHSPSDARENRRKMADRQFSRRTDPGLSSTQRHSHGRSPTSELWPRGSASQFWQTTGRQRGTESTAKTNKKTTKENNLGNDNNNINEQKSTTITTTTTTTTTTRNVTFPFSSIPSFSI